MQSAAKRQQRISAIVCAVRVYTNTRQFDDAFRQPPHRTHAFENLLATKQQTVTELGRAEEGRWGTNRRLHFHYIAHTFAD